MNNLKKSLNDTLNAIENLIDVCYEMIIKLREINLI